MQVNASQLLATRLTTSDGRAAKLQDVLIDDRDWKVRYAVVDLHLGERHRPDGVIPLRFAGRGAVGQDRRRCDQRPRDGASPKGVQNSLLGLNATMDVPFPRGCEWPSQQASDRLDAILRPTNGRAQRRAAASVCAPTSPRRGGTRWPAMRLTERVRPSL